MAEKISLAPPDVEAPAALSLLVSGLPFPLRGWNKEFVRSKHDPNNYVSAAYTFYSYLWFLGGFPVNAARIRRAEEEGWIFEEFEGHRWKRIGSKILKCNAMGIPELYSIENPQGDWNLEYSYVLKYGRVPLFKVSAKESGI